MRAATEERLSSLKVARTVQIDAPIQIAFESLLEQLGPAGVTQDGSAMPMKIEPWPGGRWFRDLGENTGHWWGTVQVIKPPSIIEINGPLFMSYPAMSHLQYRLVEMDGQTTLSFVHRAIGEFDAQHVQGVRTGWENQLEMIKRRAEVES